MLGAEVRRLEAVRWWSGDRCRVAALTLCAAHLLLAADSCTAQARRTTIPSINTPLVEWVASRPHAAPDSLATFDTAAGRTATFAAMVDSLAGRNWSQAKRHARSIGYRLVMIHEGRRTFVVAADRGSSGRDPTIVLNLDPQRDLILGAPHVPFEPGTGEQALIFLRDLAGRAAIISGAHRCASRAFTACDGTTAVCGSLQSYRDSDVGHNVATLYHVAHVRLAQRWPSSIVMSLHGMKEDTEGVRTSVIVSNGIRADDTALQTAATKFRTTVGRRISAPGKIVSCNLPADSAFGFRTLCGYTNIQGRHVNGDSNACRVSVDEGTGRFIHVEQDWDVLQAYAEDWKQIGRHPFNKAFVRGLVKVLPRVR